MRYLLVLAIGFLLLPTSRAQDVREQAKEEQRLFKSYFIAAEEYFYMEDYDEAIFNYTELLKMDPGNYNLNFLMGACYLSKYEGKERAIPYLEEAVRGVTTGYRDGSYKERNAPREAWFAMGRAYHITNEFSKAMAYYERYRNAMIKSNFADIEYVNKQIASCHTARRMMSTPVEVKFTGLGEKTEQKGATYNAVISGTGSRLIYMNDRPFYRAIMMTERTPEGWTEPRVINAEVWSQGYSFPTSLSFDGNELYLARKKGFEGDIYVSHYRDGRWEPMIPLNEEINTEFYETHACISTDGQKLYFTSDRPGGQGGIDIYVSQRDFDDVWGPAENLGPMVNSFYNEETPFITANNRTLFFSSQGHTTMGGYDIFFSDWLPDASWSLPQNIGYPINSTNDDLFYMPRRNKNQGLYSMVIPEKDPERRIYTVSLGLETDVQIAFRTGDEVLEEDSIVMDDISVGAQIIETGEGAEISEAVVRETEISGGEGEMLSERTGGTPPGNEVPDQGGGVDGTEGTEGTESIAGGDSYPGKVIPDPEEEYYVLNSVFFDFDDYNLNDSARQEVDRIYSVMNRYPDLRLEVTGHTDARGDAEYNLALSERRAESVANYLIQKGIDPERLISRGLGESAPIAMDYLEDGTDSPEGRRLNRHVDLRLYNLNHPNIEVSDVFVPNHLRPKKDYSYSVLLVESETFIDTLPDEVNGEEISMIIAGQNYLYTAGNFNNRIDAVKLLNHVIDSGFPEAQMLEKKQLEQLITDMIEGEVPPVITFTIQFMALKNPVPVTHFKDLEAVSKFEGNDGLTRYVTGEYEEIDKAFDELRIVREKGYHDAFIMYLARYRKTGL